MIQNPQFYMQRPIPQNPSAVNIQILNPQAHPNPSGQCVVMPQDLDRSIYDYRQTSLYGPMPQQVMQNPWQPLCLAYIPVLLPIWQPVYQPMPGPVWPPTPQPMPKPVWPPTPQPMPKPVWPPTPQPMPEPVLRPTPQPMPNPDSDENVNKEKNETEKNTDAVQQKPVVKKTESQEPLPPHNAINLNVLNADLQSDDLQKQRMAIASILQFSQATPDIALQVVDNQTMQSLANIIQKDTSALEGPNDRRIEIYEKLSRGEQITPEEKAAFEEGSPRELAEDNKICAMIVLAILQRLQREEIDGYNAQDPNVQVAPIKMDELIGHKEMVKAMNETQIPVVKTTAIQALSHVSRPEDKEILEKALDNAASDPDPNVQGAAKEALERINIQQPVPELKAA